MIIVGYPPGVVFAIVSMVFYYLLGGFFSYEIQIGPFNSSNTYELLS